MLTIQGEVKQLLRLHWRAWLVALECDCSIGRDEVVNEVLYRVFRAKTYHAGPAFLQVLIRRSLQDCRRRYQGDERRGQKTFVDIFSIDECGEPEKVSQLAISKECRDILQRGIRSLPPREQVIISQYFFGEQTQKAIGGILGKTEARISQLIPLGLARLKRWLHMNGYPSTVGAYL